MNAFATALLRTLTLAGLSLVLVGAPSVAGAQGTGREARSQHTGPQSTSRIEAELVPLSTWAAPGSTAVVAVRQVIKPGWHTYWRNPGDSGGATTLDWTLPAGVRADPIVWPLPQRQKLLDLTNYGYSGEVFLPVPIEIPASARPGSTLALNVRATFFVCSDEMCVPEELRLALDLPVRDGAAPQARFGRAIQSLVENAPRPAGISARVALDGRTLSLSAAGGPLVGVDTAHATFFPYDVGVIDHSATQFGQRGPQGVSLELAAAGDLVASGLKDPISGVLATDAGNWEITATPGPALSGVSGTGALTTTEDAAPPAPTNWRTVVQAGLFALIGGLILNLMPCVFPVLAMKAASLTRSAHDPAEARRDGIAFLIGVVFSFLALASVLLTLRAAGQAIGWGFQLQSPAVVAGLAILMMAVGLNLSGVFEIGTGLQSVGGSRLARLPGGTGAFFTGVLAVVVAAPCTAPFMAFALGAALVMPAPLAFVVFALLGVGLALPYLVVSLSPGLLRRLPRPGPWMERLKQILALPMYGAALWLVWVFWRQTGGLALGLILIAAVTATLCLWAFGRRQRREAVGAPGSRYAMAAVVLAVISAGIAVASVRVPREAASVTVSSLPSQPWSAQAVARAQAQGRPVLVDFTADWCVSCKINESTALNSPAVARALAETNAVYLKADWTRRDDVIAAELSRHGRSGVPLYLVYAPGDHEPRILPQLLTAGVVVEALKGAGGP